MGTFYFVNINLDLNEVLVLDIKYLLKWLYRTVGSGPVKQPSRSRDNWDLLFQYNFILPQHHTEVSLVYFCWIELRHMLALLLWKGYLNIFKLCRRAEAQEPWIISYLLADIARQCTIQRSSLVRPVYAADSQRVWSLQPHNQELWGHKFHQRSVTLSLCYSKNMQLYITLNYIQVT